VPTDCNSLGHKLARPGSDTQPSDERRNFGRKVQADTATFTRTGQRFLIDLSRATFSRQVV
jgi:hypothetical protein